MTEVVTGEAVALDVPCARFPSRLLALGAAGVPLNAASLAAVLVTALVVIIIGYPAAFETLTRGRTLGKMALGLRVVSDDGGPERFRQALMRALAAVVEIWLFTGAPALICSLLSRQGKRLGDVFAGTFVIQERLPRRPGVPTGLAVVPPPLAGWAPTLELSRLQDQTAEQAGSYLRRYYELTPAARDELGQRIAAAVAAQVTPPPPPGTPPAAFLSAVLAVRRQREADRLAAQQAGPAPAPAAAAAGAAAEAQAAAARPGAEPAAPSPARPEQTVPGDFAPPV